MLYCTIKKIEKDPNLFLQLVVTGSHLSKDHGSTIKEIINDILNDLVTNDFVTQKKIQKVKDNLIDIYKDPAFQDTERVEFSTYYEKRVKNTIVLLNSESFDLDTGELIDN